MAELLVVPDMRAGYVDVVRHVLNHGKFTEPRGLKTLEIENAVLVVEDPLDMLPVGTGRGVSSTIAAIEALQLISADDLSGLLARVAPRFKDFLERDERAWGSYGARIGTQLNAVAEKLTSDRDSRQAVITLWDAGLDNIEGKRDYPCTVALMIKLRNDRLNLTAVMRSNDAWLGLAQDAFVFTQLQWTLARCLQVDCGIYTHVASSLHLYATDWDSAASLHHPTDAVAFSPTGIGRDGTPVSEAMTRAHRIVKGELFKPTVSEAWYLSRLRHPRVARAK